MSDRDWGGEIEKRDGGFVYGRYLFDNLFL